MALMRSATADPIAPTASDHALIEEERLRIALDAGHMGIWEWDVASGRVTWSSTLEALHGIPRGSFGGTFEAYQADIHPDDRARVLATIEASAAGQDEHHLEYRIIRPDGEVRWLEARGRLVQGEDGGPPRMMGVCTDVSERKRDELERERMTEDLQRMAAFRDRLLGVVAHDLRSPLGAISMAAEMVGMQPGGARHAAVIQRSVDRMARMIEDLLDYAQGQLGSGIPVFRDQVDMGALVGAVIEELEVAHPGRVIALRADGELTGAWDAARIGQVVSNLVGNALQHGTDPVEVVVADGGDHVRLAVTNRGEAIDPELVPSLFEPFKRRQRNAPGLGLGLYIVAEIVRAHGATIEVASTVDATSFTVCWPR
jgi:sigma-B regulation protein RsbU (phosphoserine phosphatase)